MSESPRVLICDEPSLPAFLLAGRLRLTLGRPEGARLLRRLSGVFALKSARGPQAVSVICSPGEVRIEKGISRHAGVIVEADLGRPDARPTITGGRRRPLFARRVARLLSLPLPDWPESAERFWSFASSLRHIPPRLTITAADEDRSLSFGDHESEVGAQVIGPAEQLERLLAGQSILYREVAAGRLRYRGSGMHQAALSRANIKMMLGESGGAE